MRFFKRNRSKILLAAFFLGLFAASLTPSENLDLWFHLKSGEAFLQHGILYRDIFSQAHSRQWYPYEWLFQVSTYLLWQASGFFGLTITASLVFVAQIGILWLILRRILRVHPFLSVVVCIFYFFTSFDFFVLRPLLVSLLFLWLTLYLILLYFTQGKNFLILLLPATYLWANLHASVFLSTLLCLGYAVMGVAAYFLTRKTEWLKKVRLLSLTGGATFLASILPPIGLTQYRLLWYFFQNRAFLGTFISEWSATEKVTVPFLIFAAITSVICLGVTVVTISKKLWGETLTILPLLGLIILGFQAVRNVPLAYVGLAVALGFVLSHSSSAILEKKHRLTLGILLTIAALAGLALYFQDRQPSTDLNPPVGAVNFLKSNYLTGNMFNEFNYGGYILYHLYPQYKVFIDGRADIFLCCEMPDVLSLAENKNLPDPQYKKLLDGLWQKYDISFAILGTDPHLIFQRVAHILTSDPQWELIYWDDSGRIFVRKDGKNTTQIDGFGAVAATPFEQSLYRPGTMDQALLEYQRMLSITDSAHTENAIGYTLLQKGKLADARPYFERAIKLDSSFESPYMNLGELAIHNGDVKTAINLYQKALSLAPSRSLIYIRLGDFYKQEGNQSKARETWQQGLLVATGPTDTKMLQDRLTP